MWNRLLKSAVCVIKFLLTQLPTAGRCLQHESVYTLMTFVGLMTNGNAECVILPHFLPRFCYKEWQ